MKSWDSWTNWLPARFRGATTSLKKTERVFADQGGLRLRFLLVVYIALLPVAALSVWQGFERLRLDQENVRDNLRQSAYAAASDDFNVFFAAEQMLATLASDPTVRIGDTGCRTRLIKALEGPKFIGNFGRVSADGQLLCVAKPPPRLIDPRQSVWWNSAVKSRNFAIAGPVMSEALGREVLVGVLPLSRADGSFDGTLNVAIDIAWLDHVQRQKQLPRGAVVALFDNAGKVIASNNLAVARAVFARGSNVAPGTDGLLAATAPDGEAWSFAMAPLVRRDYFVGFAMPSAHLFRFTYVHVTVDLLLPVLMVILASLAIWSATDRLASRWITLLQRMATAYRGGHYAIRPLAMKEAPREFRALGDALADMAQAVQERDRGLREAVEQKALLIKEIHHRVKNNLQIVISLLSLQSSRLKDPAAREAVDQARIRVNALALVHRMIYEIDRDGLVELRPLLAEITEQLHRGFGGDRRNISLRLDVPNWSADADLAIPLTLFAIEALTNVYKHGFPEPADAGTITLKLERVAADRLKLRVEDDGRGLTAAVERDESTGGRLMEALARQVGGEVTTRARDGRGTIVEMMFPTRGVHGLPKLPEKQRETAAAAS
jgi:two-component sensor histidine kinase